MSGKPLSFTGIERILVVRSLQTHLEGLHPAEVDRPVLKAALNKIGHEALESPECLCVLRHMRLQRDIVYATKLAVEERQRGKHDGELNDVRTVIDAHLLVLDEVVRKLWECVTGGDSV